MGKKIPSLLYVCVCVVGGGGGTNSFPIDRNTNILENATPFLRIAATLVHGQLEI